MPTVELYGDQTLDVDSDDYVARSYDPESGDEVEAVIEGLDDVVLECDEVDLVLDYPFEQEYRAQLTGEITLRQIIDAIRRGFREMYRGASHAPIAGLPGNEDVKGSYGQAYHGIHDLVIEGILFHEEEGLIEVLIGS
ncbi:MAG: hypothetical protein JNL79_20250 [Myxococcales bacterium]|nr:hypothetical protein [Myxococcales bacterium]